MTEAILQNQRTEQIPSGPDAVAADACDIAYEGARDCLRAGGPDCSMTSDPYDYAEEHREGVREAATATVAEAGFDIEDVADQLDEGTEYAMGRANEVTLADFHDDFDREAVWAFNELYGKPDTTPVTGRPPSVVTPRVRMRGRTRAPRRGPARQRGSRRVARATCRSGDSGDSGDSDVNPPDLGLGVELAAARPGERAGLLAPAGGGGR